MSDREMITNDIQQLLDGSLSDEQAAELLHTLSVSPEKRIAFQQHLALSSLIGEDRGAIGLSPSEQEAIWGNIGTAVGASAQSRSTRTAGWLTRGAALLTAGVIGYLLGSVTIFSPSTAELPATSRVERPTGSAPRVATSAAPIVRDSIIYRDRIVYRDRPSIVYRDRDVIVYRDRPSAALDRTTATPRDIAGRNETSAPALQPNGSQSPESNIPQSNIRETSHSAPDATPKSAPAQAIPNSSSKFLGDSSGNGGVRIESPTATPSQQAPASIDSASPKRPTVIARSPESSPAIPDIAIASAFTRNGLELSAGQRIGMMLPVPEGIDKPDGEYTYYNADAAWRFGDGSYSVGARAIYGTFSAFTLEADETSPLNFIDATPSLEARQKFWLEGFVGYRMAITSAIALGAELSAGGSKDHLKVGGSLLAMAMFNDQWGVQLGGGFGRYWFDMSGERERLFNEHENVGIRDVAREEYNGPILEGRYGIFFKF